MSEAKIIKFRHHRVKSTSTPYVRKARFSISPEFIEFNSAQEGRLECNHVENLPPIPLPSQELLQALGELQRLHSIGLMKCRNKIRKRRTSTTGNKISRINGFTAFKSYYSRHASAVCQGVVSSMLSKVWLRDRNQDVWDNYALHYRRYQRKEPFCEWLANSTYTKAQTTPTLSADEQPQDNWSPCTELSSPILSETLGIATPSFNNPSFLPTLQDSEISPNFFSGNYEFPYDLNPSNLSEDTENSFTSESCLDSLDFPLYLSDLSPEPSGSTQGSISSMSSFDYSSPIDMNMPLNEHIFMDTLLDMPAPGSLHLMPTKPYQISHPNILSTHENTTCDDLKSDLFSNTVLESYDSGSHLVTDMGFNLAHDYMLNY